MEILGLHKNTRVYSSKDVNGRFMVHCDDCGTTAHAYELDEAKFDLSMVSCSPNCENCKNLKRSGTTRPAVPLGGDCNTLLHTCPNDGNRWWQANDHFHMWQQVTSDREWEHLKKEYSERHEYSEDESESGFGLGF